MTTKQKALAKSAKGSKSIASFFGKNPKKWNENMILFSNDHMNYETWMHLIKRRILKNIPYPE